MDFAGGVVADCAVPAIAGETLAELASDIEYDTPI